MLPLILFVAAAMAASSLVTPQMCDRFTFGHHEYQIAQQPMLAYWKIGDPPKGTGKVDPPEFDILDSANWRGYVATWRIRESQLMLDSVSCTIAGQPGTPQQVMPKHKLPTKADWFTGQIQVAVGDYDPDRKQYASVLTFHIEKGNVKRTSFKEWGHYVPSWDGIPTKESEKILELIR